MSLIQRIKDLVAEKPYKGLVVGKEGHDLYSLNLTEIVKINLDHPNPKTVKNVQYGGRIKGRLTFYALFTDLGPFGKIVEFSERLKNISIQQGEKSEHYIALSPDTRKIRWIDGEADSEEFQTLEKYLINTCAAYTHS